ncbi:MAG: hypothetical protein ACYTFI_08090 [Planctomycetota bacterium]|jgi:hypothetical protein
MVEILSAVMIYCETHGAYPPDTGPWNEVVFDPRSLHRCLGRPLRDPHTGRLREAYLPMRSKSLTDLDADGVGMFVDPWGNPYHLDATHVTRKDGRCVQIGWPYLPSRPKEKRTRDFKIVSFGPDGKSDPAYPFDWNVEHPDAKDDIRSWGCAYPVHAVDRGYFACAVNRVHSVHAAIK